MSIRTEVIADSISPTGSRLTTVQCRFHRFILPEVNTHRAFSRNSASSRATPTPKLIQQVRENPAVPHVWGKNQPGMQAAERLNASEEKSAEIHWWKAAEQAADTAEKFLAMGIHKQHANRVLEPFMWHTAVISSTEDGWANFFEQRISPLAQPEMRLLAMSIQSVINSSTPEPKDYGEWHLPYVDRKTAGRVWMVSPTVDDVYRMLREISVARCARVSYKAFDGSTDIYKDLELYKKLVTAEPPHWSPLEHVACPDASNFFQAPGNFIGWDQLRHLNEFQ